MIGNLHGRARRAAFGGAEGELSEVADVARRAGTLVSQALGVTLSTREAEGAPLVAGAPSLVAAQLRSLMVELVIAQRARHGGAVAGEGVLEVWAGPAEEAPASLRVQLSFGGSARELRLPMAGALAL